MALGDVTAAAAGAIGALNGDATGDGSQVTLAVNGERYLGWTDIDIARSLDTLTHTFSLSYTDRWLEGGIPWPIREGAKAQIHHGKKLLLTGWVNSAEWSVDGSDRALTASGRSLSGDLEDCSAIHASGHWKNASALKIIKELLTEYAGSGLSVTSKIPEALQPVAKFALQEGETVKAAIDRLCEMVAVLPISMSDGTLALVRADKPTARVVLPVEQAISRRVVTEDQNRHSNYYAVGQSWGNRNRTGEAVVKIKHQIKDAGVERHRPLVVVAEHSVAQLAQLQARATWERNIRAGRAMRYVAVLPGVLAPNGLPWEPGWHCEVSDDQMGVEESLVLVSANIRASADDLVTEVELTLPEAYSTLVYPPRKKLNPKPKPVKPAEICFPADTPGLPIPGSGF